MRSLISHCVLLAVVAIAPSQRLQAEPILNHLPPDALGFAVIRNLEATNAKVEQIVAIFQDLAPGPIPAPLPMIKAATGLGAGVNDQGDALLAILPNEESDEDNPEPLPLLLVAANDYAAFAASANGDATGEISRITIAGEEVLAAKLGSFVLLMNVENRDQMEAILAPEPEASAPGAAPEPTPLADWVVQNDFAAVITPAGMKMLTAMGKAELAGQRARFEEQYNDRSTAEILRNMRQSAAMADALLGFLDAEIDAVGLGLTIDDQTNVRLTKRVRFTKGGELAKFADLKKPDASPFIGYADQPYVFAAGGPIPPEWLGATSKLSRKLIEENASIYGFQEFKAEDWAEVEASWTKAMQGVRSASMIMLPGEEEEPLYSNVYSIFKVEDAKAYLESSRQSMKLWNGLIQRSKTDMKLAYEIADSKVGGHDALLMTVDVAAAAADPNVPQMEAMMERLIGEDGKIRMHLIAADDRTVVMGVGPEKQILAAIEYALSGNAALLNSASVQSTIQLLDPAAPWLGLVSPSGWVLWLERMMAGVMAQIGIPAPDFPDYPATPPIGFSLNFAQGEIAGEMAWPAESLTGLAKFIKACQAMAL